MVTALQLNLLWSMCKTIDQKINQEDKEWATDMVVTTLATGMAKET
jgi:hypothetical protein